MKSIILFLSFSFISNLIFTQVIVDGVKSMGEYPAIVSGVSNPIAIQGVMTQFGDNLSELDAMYINYDQNNLYIFLSGNLENNFNKLELFIDSKAGGQNTILPIPPNPIVDQLSFMPNGALQPMDGLIFDTGFEPDFYFTIGHGISGSYQFGIHFGILGDDGSGVSIGSPTMMGTLPNGTMVALDNSNTIGVTGGTDAAVNDPALVNTGLEFKIPLNLLMISPGNEFRLLAFVNNSSHNFASNQFLPPLSPPQGNLGGDGAGNFTNFLDFNMNNFAGQQFVRHTILLPPTADFSFTTNSLSATFTDLSTENPTSWLWDFGDGNTSTQQNPIHNYAAYGTYIVCETVTNQVNTDSSCAYLTLVPPPAYSKSFSPDMVTIGDNSTLTFTIDNSASVFDATALNFTDNLPIGMEIANPSNASTTCTGGILTAASGTSVISYSGGNVSANSGCTVQVDITSIEIGNLINNSGNLTSSLGNSGPSSATLTVSAPIPTLGEWGIIGLALLLSIIGLIYIRHEAYGGGLEKN